MSNFKACWPGCFYDPLGKLVVTMDVKNPIPKKPRPSQNNDYRSVALTSLLMKCLERILLRRISTETSQFQDPHQFAYRRNRSTQDAILTHIHHGQKHLDTPTTSARILFLDFSSAFNTIQPHILLQKLRAILVNPSLRKWNLDFLTDRKHWVKINNTIFSIITTNIGAPQGCVSSPALFSVYTSDCRPVDSFISKDHLFKYADDKALLSLITENNHQIYETEIPKTWFHGVIRTVSNSTPRKLRKWSMTSVNYNMTRLHYPSTER